MVRACILNYVTKSVARVYVFSIKSNLVLLERLSNHNAASKERKKKGAEEGKYDWKCGGFARKETKGVAWHLPTCVVAVFL